MSQHNGVEFSLRRRLDTRNYFADFYLSGKRWRISLKTIDKTVAHTIAKRKIGEIYDKLVPSASISFLEFYEKYFRFAETRHAPNTVQTHRVAFNHLLEFKKFPRPSSITNNDVDDFMTWLIKEKNMKPVSANTTVRGLRGIFNNAYRWNYIIDNPFNRVRLLKHGQKEVRVLTHAEVMKILKYADRHHQQFADLFRFYLLTGMRASEPLQMQWSNVHWKEQYISTTFKTKYNRQVPIFPEVKKILQKRKHLAQPFPLDRRNVRRALILCCKLGKKTVQIQGVSVQTFRSSTYSHLVSLGVPQPLVRKIIGHTNDKTGQIHYFNMPIKDVISQTKRIQSLIA